MKAIILNSGTGKRMRPFTDKKPKCLIKLNGKTILEHEIDNLLHYGIKNMIITVGPFEEKIKKFIIRKFPGLNVTYVKNELYNSTNYIYSMWLTRHLIDDDIVLLHGDMVFDKKLLGRLLAAKYPNCALVNNNIKPPEKDFKGEVINNRIKKIGVDISGKNAFFLAPIYKFSNKGFHIWMEEIERFLKNGKDKVYAEDAFNEVSDKIQLHPIYFDKELCMEIDNFDDLETARNFFKTSKI